MQHRRPCPLVTIANRKSVTPAARSPNRGQLSPSVRTAAEHPMIPWLKSKDRRRELDRIEDIYPGARFQLSPSQRIGAVLFVPIRPVPDDTEQGRVFADLQRGFTVAIDSGGKVRHRDDDCGGGDDHEVLLAGLHLPRRSWLIALAYPPQPGNPFPIHPRARVVVPSLSLGLAHAHPHMHKAPREGRWDAWACPLPPHTTGWQWYPGATLAYLDQVTFWILKTEVWLATGGGVGQMGTWLGGYASHEPGDVLSNIGPDDPCRCGRGIRYADCHLPLDVAAAIHR